MRMCKGGSHHSIGITRHRVHIVYPESFKSNTQITIAFARKNRPRVHRNDEFVCVYLRSRAFASTVRDRPRVRTCIRTYIRIYVHNVNSI